MAKSYPNCRKLLSFESDDCVYGLNFSDEVEALSMRTHLERRHEAEKSRLSSQTMQILFQINGGIYTVP